jgi:hypothetical protein
MYLEYRTGKREEGTSEMKGVKNLRDFIFHTTSSDLCKIVQQSVECNNHCMATFCSGPCITVGASNLAFNFFKSAALEDFSEGLTFIQPPSLHISPSVEDCNALFKCRGAR